MSEVSAESPLYCSQEKAIIKVVAEVPVGYVTSNVAIAAVIYATNKPRNGGGNVQKTLGNLVGRADIPAHRVLRNSPCLAKRVRLMVRDADHIPILRGEGVSIDDLGHLTDDAAFWDFSQSCVQRYQDQNTAAASATASTHAVDGGQSSVATTVARTSKSASELFEDDPTEQDGPIQKQTINQGHNALEPPA